MHTLQDGESIGGGRRLLVSGAAARLVEHANGRTAATELLAAPARLGFETSPELKLVALGPSIGLPIQHVRGSRG